MKVLLRTVPILLLSIFLSYYLKISLLIISGLLFCYLIYIWDKAGSLTNFQPDIKKLIYMSLGITLGSKILFYLKDIYLSHVSLAESLQKPIVNYKICYLSATYQSFGFIKRGLIPTIVSLISSNYVVQIYLVQGIGLATFLAGLVLINRKLESDTIPKNLFLSVLLLSPIGIYAFFNYNLGFYDMILVGLLLISISLKHRSASMLVDMIGLFVHEAYIFLRLPFLILSLITQISQKKPFAPVLKSIAVNLFVFVLIILTPRPGFEELKANYFAHFPSLVSTTTAGDMAAFFPLCREGTIAYDIRDLRIYYGTEKAASYILPFSVSLIGLTLLSFFTSNLTGRKRFLDSVASVFAFCFPLLLGVVGGDLGRWLAFSFICWAVYYFLFRPDIFTDSRLSFPCIYTVLLIAFLFTPFGINYSPLFFK